MIICIDFDGVVADTCAAKRSWLLGRYGVSTAFGNLSRSALLPVIGRATYDAMQKAVDTVPVSEIEPLPGCIDVLRRLGNEATLHLISARSQHRMEWVLRWLAMWDVRDLFQSVHTSWGATKGTIAGELGASILIDNDQRHFNALPSGVLPILLARDQVLGAREFAVAGNWNGVEMLVRK